MPELPENKRCMWMFPDNVDTTKEFKFLDFNPEYKTSTGKKVPCFILWGTLKARAGTESTKEFPAFEGELVTTIWNIYNFDDLKKQLGKNTDDWNTDLFFKITIEHDKFVLIPVEAIQETLSTVTS